MPDNVRFDTPRYPVSGTDYSQTKGENKTGKDRPYIQSAVKAVLSTVGSPLESLKNRKGKVQAESNQMASVRRQSFVGHAESVKTNEPLSGKQKHILNEMFTTEKTYSEQLSAITQIFDKLCSLSDKQLQAEFDQAKLPKPYPTKQELKAFRDDFQAIQKQSKNILDQLEKANKSTDPSEIAKCFDKIDKLFTDYTASMINISFNYMTTINTFANLGKLNTVQTFFKASQDSKLRTSDIPSLTITSIQRLPRWGLLTGDFLKSTGIANQAKLHASLEKLNERAVQSATDMNEANRNYDTVSGADPKAQSVENKKAALAELTKNKFYGAKRLQKNVLSNFIKSIDKKSTIEPTEVSQDNVVGHHQILNTLSQLMKTQTEKYLKGDGKSWEGLISLHDSITDLLKPASIPEEEKAHLELHIPKIQAEVNTLLSKAYVKNLSRITNKGFLGLNRLLQRRHHTRNPEAKEALKKSLNTQIAFLGKYGNKDDPETNNVLRKSIKYLDHLNRTS